MQKRHNSQWAGIYFFQEKSRKVHIIAGLLISCSVTAAAPGARGHPIWVGCSQAGRQTFWLRYDADGTAKAHRTRTCISVDERAAAGVGDFATESQLLRQSRSLLYHLRFTPDETGTRGICPTPRKGKRLSTAPIQLSSRSPVKLCCNNLGHHSAASASRSMLNGVWLNSIVPNKLTCCQATGETPLMMFIAAWSPVPCFCT